MRALDTLGWVIVHAIWQGALITGGLAIFLRFGRAPSRLRYGTAFGALLLVVAAPVATAALLASAKVTVIDGPTAIAARGIGTGTHTPLVLTLYTALALVTRWMALVWLACVAVLLVRWCGGWWLVARLATRGARPARPAWEASLRTTASRMGVASSVELLESSAVDTPTVVGHRRPVVLLPVPAFEVLASAEAESVLAHELAHVRRADFAANGVQSFVEILFFFHPAVRWLSRTVRDERELCCDDVAVEAAESRLVYARALAQLETVRSSLGGRQLALGASGGTLLRRIQRLANTGDSVERSEVSSRLGAMLTLVATLVLMAALGSLVVPATLQAIALVNPVADRYTVRAQDPAGEFTVTFERGRPTRATVAGVTVGPGQLVTRGDSLFLPWGSAGSFAVRVKLNGFTWTPRRRSP
jgi:beta-lactamase regulating signal transducer with metallopeptidase domain